MKAADLKYPYLQITALSDYKEALIKIIECAGRDVGYLYGADKIEVLPNGKEYRIYYQWYDLFTVFGAAEYVYEGAEKQGFVVKIEIVHSAAITEMLPANRFNAH